VTALLLSLALLPGAAQAPTLWVSNERAGTLTVIDTATDRMVATVAVGGRPRGIQASPDGRTVYVAVSRPANARPGAPEGIVAVDAASRRVRARFAAGTDPEQFAVGRDGAHLYASNEDAGTTSVGEYWLKPVSKAARAQAASSKTPSTVTSASIRGGLTSRLPERP